MKVEIRNTTPKYRKCSVFGQFDDAMLMEDELESKFIDFKTDEGVEILVDGDSDSVKRNELIEGLFENPFHFKEMEFSSSVNNPNAFMVATKDANGNIIINNVNPIFWLKPTQTEIYPIAIPSTHYGLNGKIDNKTSFAFYLQPNETITLNFKK